MLLWQVGGSSGPVRNLKGPGADVHALSRVFLACLPRTGQGWVLDPQRAGRTAGAPALLWTGRGREGHPRGDGIGPA